MSVMRAVFSARYSAELCLESGLVDEPCDAILFERTPKSAGDWPSKRDEPKQ